MVSLLHPQTTVFPTKRWTLKHWQPTASSSITCPFLPQRHLFFFSQRHVAVKHLSGRRAVPVPIYDRHCVKWVMPESFSHVRLIVFPFSFSVEKILGIKIRKIILKSAKRRFKDPQFEGKGLATLIQCRTDWKAGLLKHFSSNSVCLVTAWKSGRELFALHFAHFGTMQTYQDDLRLVELRLDLCQSVSLAWVLRKRRRKRMDWGGGGICRE